MSRAPFFSVLVPSYNQADYLPQALDSLLAQDETDWEAVVVDDGSTDDTAAVAAGYAARDARIRWQHQDNGGCAAALNTGLSLARGSWFGWLSSDDLFEPDALSGHRRAIRDNPDIRCFHSHFFYLTQETGEKSAPDPWIPIPERAYRVSRFFRANYVHGNAIMLHREAVARAGRFDVALRQAQDFDMWLRLAALYPWQYSTRRTCVTRWHAGQTTNTFPQAGLYDSARACLKFANRHGFADFFPDFDLRDPAKARLAAEETLGIALYSGSFMHQAGYDTFFVDRFREWLADAVDTAAGQAALTVAREALAGADATRAPALVVRVLADLVAAPGPYRYAPRTVRDVIDRQLADPSTPEAKQANLRRYRERLDRSAANGPTPDY